MVKANVTTKILAVLLAVMVGMSFSFADADAASAATKKPAKKITLRASASGQHAAYLSWNKIKKPQKGYAVFRDGKCIARLSKKRTSYSDSGLAAGSGHTYQIKIWKKKGKGKKAKFKYSKASNKVGIRTASAPAQEGGSSGGTPSGSGTTTPSSKTVTDYLGVKRTITKAPAFGSNAWTSEEDSSVWREPLTRIDRTIPGEFTISGGETMVQTGGSDSATFYKRELNGNPTQRVELQTTTQSMTWDADREFGIRMYGGDPSKLTYEVNHSLETVNTYAQTGWYEYTPITEKYIKASSGGTYLQRVLQMEVGKLKYPNKTAVYGFSCFLMKPDRTTMCGFKNESITVTIKYNSKKVGAITWTPCEVYKNGAWTVSTVNGMTPNRALAWQIAQEAVAANGGSKSYYEDMNWIQSYFYDTYEYGETIYGDGGATLSAGCEGGAFVLATYSMKQYGIGGFNGYGSQDPNESSHTSFNLNSDPSMYFETQGH